MSSDPTYQPGNSTGLVAARLEAQRAAYALQMREWERVLAAATPKTVHADFNRLTLRGAVAFYALSMMSEQMSALRRIECEHMWYITVRHPDGSSVWAWVNTAYIRRNLMFGAMAVNNAHMMPMDDPPLTFRCPVRELDQMKITFSCVSPETGETWSTTHSLLDHMPFMSDYVSRFTLELHPELHTAMKPVYSFSGLQNEAQSDALYHAVSDFVVQRYVNDIRPDDPQARFVDRRHTIPGALRDAFPTEVLHFVFAPRIYGHYEGRSFDHAMEQRFLARYPRHAM